GSSSPPASRSAPPDRPTSSTWPVSSATSWTGIPRPDCRPEEGSEQVFSLQPCAQILGTGEEVAVHADGLGRLDVDQPVVDQQGVLRPQPEAVEREIIDSGVGLEQFDLARDDDIAEAPEEVALLVIEGRPEVGREIGNREQ